MTMIVPPVGSTVLGGLGVTGGWGLKKLVADVWLSLTS